MPADIADLAGRRILITGGTGFLGRSLLDHVVAIRDGGGDAGDVEVLTRSRSGFLDRFPQYRDRPGLRFIQGSLDDLVTMDGDHTDLIHAADDTHRQGGRQDWFRQIVTGTDQALAFARRAGVRRFLLVSSGAVYGPQSPSDGSPWRETANSAPRTTDISSAYANGKRAAEHLCALHNAENDIDCVIARCFALLSEHIPLDGPYAAGNFIRDALSDAHETIEVKGDGTPVRTYLSGRDMAHWMFTLLQRGVPGEAYNVGAEEPISMRALAELVRDTLAPGKAVAVQGGVASSDRDIYVPDIGKAKELGLEANLSLPATIANVGATLRANRSSMLGAAC